MSPGLSEEPLHSLLMLSICRCCIWICDSSDGRRRLKLALFECCSSRDRPAAADVATEWDTSEVATATSAATLLRGCFPSLIFILYRTCAQFRPLRVGSSSSVAPFGRSYDLRCVERLPLNSVYSFVATSWLPASQTIRCISFGSMVPIKMRKASLDHVDFLACFDLARSFWAESQQKNKQKTGRGPWEVPPLPAR